MAFKLGANWQEFKDKGINPEQAKIFASMGESIAGGQPDYSATLTEEERAKALQAYKNAYGQAQQIFTSPIYGGGVGVSGPGFKTGKQVRQEGLPQAYAAFAAETGAPERSGGYGKQRGFKKWLKKRGGDYGLRIKNGRIQGKKEFTPGGFQSQTDPLKDLSTQYGQQVLGSLMGMAPMLGQDLASGMQFRGGIRNMLGQEFADMGPEGLTAADEADLSAMRAGYMQDIGDQFRNLSRQFTGEMTGRGFGSSSLFNRGTVRNVLDPTSRNLVRANAALASEENTRKNSAAARRQSRIQSMLAGAGALGSSNLAPLTQALISPSQYGGWTDPQAGSFGAQLKGAGTGLAQTKAAGIRDILMTPTNPAQQGPGAGGIIGGALSGAGAGAMLGPWGAAGGALLGAIGGGMK